MRAVMMSAGFLSVVLTGQALAQVDPRSLAPPAILQMDSLPNAGRLLVRYCLLGFCVERSTSCHGQCCFQGEADALGYGCSGDVYGSIPRGFSYAGWRCEPYGQHDDSLQLSGIAGPVPAHISQCRNLR